MGIESNLDTPLARAVRKVGGQSAFGRLVGLSQTRVYELLRDTLPLPADDGRVLKAEAATGVSRHELRPDIYPPEQPGSPRAGDRVSEAAR